MPIGAHNDCQEDSMGRPPAPHTPAPDFSLPDGDGRQVRLRGLRGRTVVLVFYPADWTPASTSELALIQETLREIQALHAQILGISCDSRHSHHAWAERLNLTVPLLSDFWPHGEVSRRYGVFRSDLGTSDRALIFVDARGTVREVWVADNPEIAPGLNVLFEGLERLRHEPGEAHA
jgi:peroxiredoxin